MGHVRHRGPVLVVRPKGACRHRSNSVKACCGTGGLCSVSRAAVASGATGRGRCSREDLVQTLIDGPPTGVITTRPSRVPSRGKTCFRPRRGYVCMEGNVSTRRVFRDLISRLMFTKCTKNGPSCSEDRSTFRTCYTSCVLSGGCKVSVDRFSFARTPRFFRGVRPRRMEKRLSGTESTTGTVSKEVTGILRRSGGLGRHRRKETRGNRGRSRTGANRRGTRRRSHNVTHWRRPKGRGTG